MDFFVQFRLCGLMDLLNLVMRWLFVFRETLKSFS